LASAVKHAGVAIIKFATGVRIVSQSPGWKIAEAFLVVDEIYFAFFVAQATKKAILLLICPMIVRGTEILPRGTIRIELLMKLIITEIRIRTQIVFWPQPVALYRIPRIRSTI
jgi:hypothetical protein